MLLRAVPLPSLVFLVATVLLDLVLPKPDGRAAYFFALMVGQMFVLGGWLALGQSHRLLRSLCFVLLTAVLALLMGFKLRHSAWHDDLARVSILTGGTAIWTALCRIAIRTTGRTWNSATADRPLRFPVRELFAWTIVVALASTLFRSADFRFVTRINEGLIVILAVTFTAGLVMALFLSEKSGRLLVPTILAGIAMTTLFTALSNLRSPQWRADDSWMVAGAYCYVGVWILAQRLDRSFLAAEVAPSVDN